MAKKTLLVLLFGIVSLAAAGCGKGENDTTLQPQKAHLTGIHELYTLHVKKIQQPPTQLSDLTGEEFAGAYPEAVRGLKEGTYVVVLGVSDKGSGTVLAYEKDAPTQGGVVLMADGTVKMMSAAEFQAAAKVQK